MKPIKEWDDERVRGGGERRERDPINSSSEAESAWRSEIGLQFVTSGGRHFCLL